MTYNRPSGANVEELRERAACAIAREWGISEDEAREALERVVAREQRLGTDVARGQVWAAFPEPRGQVDLTEPVEVALIAALRGWLTRWRRTNSEYEPEAFG